MENNLDLTRQEKKFTLNLSAFTLKKSHHWMKWRRSEIAVPDDVTNEARALLLLQNNGFDKIDEAAGLKATKRDIIEDSKNIEIVELPAEQIPRALADLTATIINGNYAIGAGLSPDEDAIVAEQPGSLAADTYANIVAIKKVMKTGKTKNTG